MATTGFKYYFDYLGLDEETYAVHYDFRDCYAILGSGLSGRYPVLEPFFYPSIANSNYTGLYTPFGNYLATGQHNSGDIINAPSTNSGSGKFAYRDYLQISNPSGLHSDYWTHLFLYQKSGTNSSVLFDSLLSGNPYSGYRIGINQNNNLYFEYWDDEGPNLVTSDLALSIQNLVAAVKSNNTLSLYSIDIQNSLIDSESFTIDDKYLLPSYKAILGNYIEGLTSEYLGYIDEYVYFKEALNPTTLQVLSSGFYSYPQTISGEVTSYTTTGVTGMEYFVTGATGVTGYANTITGSGVDAFGDTIFYCQIVPQTGYINSGSGIRYLSGTTTTYITGDSREVIYEDLDFVSKFGFDSYTINKPITGYVNAYAYSGHANVNNIVKYDSSEQAFVLDKAYNDNNIQVYVSGVPMFNSGFSVTGEGYNTGALISGDYYLDGKFLRLKNPTNEILFDEIVDKTGVSISPHLISGMYSDWFGNSGAWSGMSSNFSNPVLTKNPLVFLGKRLLREADYIINGDSLDFGLYPFLGSGYFGEVGPQISGIVTLVVLSGVTHGETFCRKTACVFADGLRLTPNRDFFETSSLSLTQKSGIVDISGYEIYNGEYPYWE